MMKKYLKLAAISLAVITVLVLMASCSSSVTDEKGFVLSLDKETDTYVITGFSGTGVTEITLPDSYQGKAVTAVASSAFAGNEILEAVTVPASIKSIGSLAFSGCKQLRQVTFAEGSALTVIETGVFSDCTSLRSAAIPAGVTEVGYRAFSGCTSLVSVELPASLTKVYYYAFSGCSALAEVKLADGIETLSVCANAFADCRKLTALGTPFTVSGAVDEHEYVYKKGAQYLTADGGKTLARFIDSDAASFEIPKEITKISAGAFADITSLTELTVAAENETFVAVDGLVFSKDMTTLIACPAGKVSDELNVPEGVTELAPRAFAGNTGLTSVVLPSTLKTLSEGAFDGCTGLKTLTLKATEIGFAVNSLNSVVLETLNFGGDEAAWTAATSDIAAGNDTLKKFPAPSYIR